MSGTVDIDKPSYIRVFTIVIVACFLHCSTGIVNSWASPAIPELNLTTSEKSLITGLPGLGSAFGPFIVTLCLDSIGRKGTIYVLWTFFVASWILLLISKNIIVVYIGRVIGGIGVGAAFAGLPVYVAEVAIMEIRGPLGSMGYFFLSIGVLMTYVIGPLVDYYSLSIFGLVIALIFIVPFYFVPESPYYYIKKGRRKDAATALQRIRGYRTWEKLEEEINDIENTIKSEDQNVVNFREAIRSRVSLKAIGIGIYLVAMQQFTAIGPLTANAQTIFDKAKLSFNSSYVTVMLAISNMFSISPLFLVNKVMSMRFALLLSGFGSGIFVGLFGLYFYLLEDGAHVSNYSFLSVISIMLAALLANVGIVPLTWPVVAEILPPSVKGFGTGVCGCISSLLAFACTSLFTLIADKYGYSEPFFGFAGVMLISTVGAIFFVPDTTGKTMQEIQELLAK